MHFVYLILEKKVRQNDKLKESFSLPHLARQRSEDHGDWAVIPDTKTHTWHWEEFSLEMRRMLVWHAMQCNALQSSVMLWQESYYWSVLLFTECWMFFFQQEKKERKKERNLVVMVVLLLLLERTEKRESPFCCSGYSTISEGFLKCRPTGIFCSQLGWHFLYCTQPTSVKRTLRFNGHFLNVPK